MSFQPQYIPEKGGMVVFDGPTLHVYSNGFQVYQGDPRAFVQWEQWDALGATGPGMKSSVLLYTLTTGQALPFYDMKVASLFQAVGFVLGAISAGTQKEGLWYAFGDLHPQPPSHLIVRTGA